MPIRSTRVKQRRLPTGRAVESGFSAATSGVATEGNVTSGSCQTPIGS